MSLTLPTFGFVFFTFFQAYMFSLGLLALGVTVRLGLG